MAAKAVREAPLRASPSYLRAHRHRFHTAANKCLKAPVCPGNRVFAICYMRRRRLSAEEAIPADSHSQENTMLPAVAYSPRIYAPDIP